MQVITKEELKARGEGKTRVDVYVCKPYVYGR